MGVRCRAEPDQYRLAQVYTRPASFTSRFCPLLSLLLPAPLPCTFPPHSPAESMDILDTRVHPYQF